MDDEVMTTQDGETDQNDESQPFDLGTEEEKKEKRVPYSFAKLVGDLEYTLMCRENEQWRGQIKDRRLSISVWPRRGGSDWTNYVINCVVYITKNKVPLFDDDGQPATHDDGNPKMTYVLDSWCETELRTSGGVKPFVITMKDGLLKQVTFKGTPQLGLYPDGEYTMKAINYDITDEQVKPLLRLLAEMYLCGVRALRNVFLMYNYKKQDKPSGNGSASGN